MRTVRKLTRALFITNVSKERITSKVMEFHRHDRRAIRPRGISRAELRQTVRLARRAVNANRFGGDTFSNNR
ncbi:hypothetical protein PUN28_003523 [Cardiocondyla obscurior]|uniref:Uncharacterized protein n=1 Tax=Cardiocondyla obscurior TaxID=286306 RepID=A0AAW2GM94_9HYME